MRGGYKDLGESNTKEQRAKKGVTQAGANPIRDILWGANVEWKWEEMHLPWEKQNSEGNDIHGFYSNSTRRVSSPSVGYPSTSHL